MTADKTPKNSAPTAQEFDENICFVISPIGKEGTETYDKFKEVLEYIIKPAVASSALKLNVVRADDINRAGSFIKDILEHILNSQVVIADLTDQNPNVFYELGVRHSLTPRTIMIAQSMDNLPSDLREYRTIIYDTSAKGSKLFQERLHQFLEDIKNDPSRADNPVLDKLSSYRESKIQRLEEEVAKLNSELKAVLKGEIPKPTKVKPVSLEKRIKRICTIMNAEIQTYGGTFVRTIDGKETSYSLPKESGNFDLYFILTDDKKSIADYWYISVCEKDCNLEEEMAEIRVLAEACSKGQNVDIKFIIATNNDFSGNMPAIQDGFKKLKQFIASKQRKYFKLELWDMAGLKEKEKELGIRVIDL